MAKLRGRSYNNGRNGKQVSMHVIALAFYAVIVTVFYTTTSQ